MVDYYTYVVPFLEDMNKSMSLSEFEKYFNKPHQTLKIHLKKLVDSKILIIDKRERFLFYRINLDNPLTYEYIIICEKERMLKILTKEIFHRLYLSLTPYFIDSSISIFGSSANNTQFNDIDILVLSKNKAIRDALKKFELIYSIKIHLIQTTENNLTKTFKKELQKKHLFINNHEYFVNLLYNSS
jgi:predicted nucleotidyltransferase